MCPFMLGLEIECNFTLFSVPIVSTINTMKIPFSHGRAVIKNPDIRLYHSWPFPRLKWTYYYNSLFQAYKGSLTLIYYYVLNLHKEKVSLCEFFKAQVFLMSILST